MEGVDFIDVQGADTIRTLGRRGHEKGIDVRLARVRDPVLQMLNRVGAIEPIGEDHVHASNQEAVNAILASQRDAPTSSPAAG